jgi:CDP-paratose 2-epimerase
MSGQSRGRSQAPVVILGGAGFIGCNLADRLLREGQAVRIVDNLSRPGVERNLLWLEGAHGSRVEYVIADVADAAAMRQCLKDAGAVFNFAAQVAVTTSLEDPMADFRTNALGSLIVLEVVRALRRPVPIVFASTNKVYGCLSDIAMGELDDRYTPADDEIRARGIAEDRPLDFCTPYGCSKGVADQYVLDYARSFGLPTAVLRMSCIYGPRQCGTEDQGWVAHFLIRALEGTPITIYGDGKQVRDVLHVADAVDAYCRVLENITTVSGQVFNLGGGPRNAVSLQMVLREMARLTARDPRVEFGEMRTGDQLYFVADTRKLSAAVGWHPQVGWRDGLADLTSWLRERATEDGDRQRKVTA